MKRQQRHIRKVVYSKAPGRTPGQVWLHKKSGHKYVLVEFSFDPKKPPLLMRTWDLVVLSKDGSIMVAKQEADMWENDENIECVFSPSSRDV